MSDDEVEVQESENSESESTEVRESSESSSKPENKMPSWFDKLKVARPSDLARKRKIHANPPPEGKKRSQTTSTTGKRNYDPKKVSPSKRVCEFPGEHLTVSSGKLFLQSLPRVACFKKERTSKSCEEYKARM